MKRLLPVAAVAGLLLWAGADLAPATRRRAAQQRARCEIRRTAVDLRADPLHRMDGAARRIPQPGRRAVVHRRAGRRTEPVAPRAHRDRHPGQRSGRADARGSESVVLSVDLHGRTGQPPVEGRGGADPARVPAARRHADLRRLPRSHRMGEPRERAAARVPRSQDHRPAADASDLSLLLSVRQLSRRRPGSARSCRDARGRRAATSRTCARSKTTTAARWSSSTGTSTWATAGSGRTRRTFRAT